MMGRRGLPADSEGEAAGGEFDDHDHDHDHPSPDSLVLEDD